MGGKRHESKDVTPWVWESRLNPKEGRCTSLTPLVGPGEIRASVLRVNTGPRGRRPSGHGQGRGRHKRTRGPRRYRCVRVTQQQMGESTEEGPAPRALLLCSRRLGASHIHGRGLRLPILTRWASRTTLGAALHIRVLLSRTQTLRPREGSSWPLVTQEKTASFGPRKVGCQAGRQTAP